jgi:PKD repeat protein
VQETSYITVSAPVITPVAAFSASTTSGTEPLTVTFTDSSVNSPTSWYWDFGDGSSSTVENPSYTYTTPGTYSVVLMATNSAGSNTTAATTVTVNQPVVSSTTTVSTSLNPSTLGDNVTFTAAVSPNTATGTVQFVVDGTAVGSPVTVISGTAAYTVSTLAVGNHTVEAEYNGDTYDLASNGTLSPVQVVNPTSSTTTVTSSANPEILGNSVTFTAAVSPSTATGTVQFKIDGTAVGSPVTLSSTGTATYTASALTLGKHAVEADYAGDINDTASIGILTQTTEAVPSSVAIASSLNPAAYGKSVYFTATVSPSAATGTIQFMIDGTAFGSPVKIASGTAKSQSISTLTGGTHTIEAYYSGDSTYATSVGSLTQTVTPTTSSGYISSSKNPSTYGDTVTFTTHIVPVKATGTVQFTIDGTDFGSPVTISGGTATSQGISTLTGGTHIVEANYSGDANDAANSWTMGQSVRRASDTITLSSSTAQVVYGQPATFTATISPSVATGNVTFKDGTSTLGTVAATNGVAVFTSTKPFRVGIHSITAVYNGDSNYAKTTSSGVSLTVTQASTTTSVSSSLNPSAFRKSVILTATVSVNAPGAGTPRGTVMFYDGMTAIGKAPITKPWIAVSTLSTRTHTITVVYSGDSNFATSTSAAITQTVTQAPTLVTVKSSPNPSTAIQSVTLVATGMSRYATGTVTFNDGTTALGTVSVTSGSARYTSAPMSAGTHIITAVYSGDATYAGNTSTAITQTVNLATTATSLRSSLNPSASGRQVTFAVYGIPSAATGTETFYDGTTILGSIPVKPGSARYTTSALSVGTHTISAVYSGDSVYAGSTTPALTQTVNAKR